MVTVFQVEPAGIGRVCPPHPTLPRHLHQTPVVERATGSPVVNPVRTAEVVTVDDASQEFQLAVVERIPSLHAPTLPFQRTRARPVGHRVFRTLSGETANDMRSAPRSAPVTGIASSR
jgi:hypothetical protein